MAVLIDTIIFVQRLNAALYLDTLGLQGRYCGMQHLDVMFTLTARA